MPIMISTPKHKYPVRLLNAIIGLFFRNGASSVSLLIFPSSATIALYQVIRKDHKAFLFLSVLSTRVRYTSLGPTVSFPVMIRSSRCLANREWKAGTDLTMNWLHLDTYRSYSLAFQYMTPVSSCSIIQACYPDPYSFNAVCWLWHPTRVT